MAAKAAWQEAVKSFWFVRQNKLGMNNFEKWDKEFRSQNLYVFNHNENALLWLKVRAVCRSKQLERFLHENQIELSSRKLAEKNKELFELLENNPIGEECLNSFLRLRSNEWYAAKGIDESQLKEELYKVRHYAWGGNQNNSLDKHLVSKYVKVITDFDDLQGKQKEISENAWNYVQTSWYNHWSSYLIESLFKKHPRVISAVGEIKSVDFFIDNTPIDLKVTFFPSQFLEEKLREKLGKKELSWLKEKAKSLHVEVDGSLPPSQQYYVLTEKLSDLGHRDVLDMLRKLRREVVVEARENSLELMRWLYAHQGEMRFGAENRIFVILTDADDMTNSWKMKRAFNLIEPAVKRYLDDFDERLMKEISFTFRKESYKALADVIFIVKE
ncbi:MAG: hypothetical protein ACI3YC_05385 [Alloprevotella sp.]